MLELLVLVGQLLRKGRERHRLGLLILLLLQLLLLLELLLLLRLLQLHHRLLPLRIVQRADQRVKVLLMLVRNVARQLIQQVLIHLLRLHRRACSRHQP